MSVDANDGIGLGEAGVDQMSAVEHAAADLTQSFGQAFGRLEHGMEDRASQQLLLAIGKNLRVHAPAVHLAAQPTGQLSNLVERPSLLGGGWLALVGDAKSDHRQDLVDALLQSFEASGVRDVASGVERSNHEGQEAMARLVSHLPIDECR
nr:hypothetical protein [Blastococcus sp. TML/C7B]